VSDRAFDVRQTSRRSITVCEPRSGRRVTVFALKEGSVWGEPQVELSDVAFQTLTEDTFNALAKAIEETFAEYERRFGGKP
jgi:hypothetical protein